MAGRWTVLVVVLTLLEGISTNNDDSHEQLDMKEFRLSKSLGYAIRKNFGKTDQYRPNLKMYQYRDATKTTQDISFESYEEQADRKPGRFDKGESDRMRHSAKLQSAAGARRSRSEALRRQKLNSQGLTSHQKHSKENKSPINPSAYPSAYPSTL